MSDYAQRYLHKWEWIEDCLNTFDGTLYSVKVDA